MRIFIIILLSFSCTSLLAQTKKIAFKSHSGNAENFKIALENNLFDMDASNFGLPASKEVFTKTLDTVIYISEDQTILITSRYRTQTFPKKTKPVLLSSTRDTVYNDPLFANKHNLDSIKRVLKQESKYQNPVEKIIFKGFDNKRNKKTAQQLLLPVATNSNQRINSADVINATYKAETSNIYEAFDSSVIKMLLIIFILSLVAGLIIWKSPWLRQAIPLSAK